MDDTHYNQCAMSLLDELRAARAASNSPFRRVIIAVATFLFTFTYTLLLTQLV